MTFELSTSARWASVRQSYILRPDKNAVAPAGTCIVLPEPSSHRTVSEPRGTWTAMSVVKRGSDVLYSAASICRKPVSNVA